MAETKIITIESVDDAEYGGKEYKKVMDTNGLYYNVKQGQEGKLKDKWDLLKPGTRINLIFGIFKNKKFVQDIELAEEASAPIESPPTTRYGKSPEELELSRRSFALSYAKDLAVAERIDVCDIASVANDFYKWLREGQGTSTIQPKMALPEEIPEPEVEEIFWSQEQPITEAQFNVINGWLKDSKSKARINDLVKAFGWKMASIRQLSQPQAAHLIDVYSKEAKQ